MKTFIKENKTKILNFSFVLICLGYVLSYFGGTGDNNTFMYVSSAVLFISSAMAAVL